MNELNSDNCMNCGSQGTSFDKSPPVDVEEYDSKIRLFCGAYEEIFKLSHCCLKANLPRDASILVAGAGTGTEITEFAPANPGWSFYGVDPSGHMLAVARKKIDEMNVLNEIQLFQGYVDDLGADGVFDAATCILVMHFLDDDGAKLGLLKSIHRNMKDGAPLVLVDGCGETGSMVFNETVKSWKQYPVLHGVTPDAVETAFSEVILDKIRFVPERRILELLAEAGFVNVFRFYSGFLYSGWTAFKG